MYLTIFFRRIMNKESDLSSCTDSCLPSGVGELCPTPTQDMFPLNALEDETPPIEPVLTKDENLETKADDEDHKDLDEGTKSGEEDNSMENGFSSIETNNEAPEETDEVPGATDTVSQTGIPITSGEKGREEIPISNAKCGTEYLYDTDAFIRRGPLISVTYSDNQGDLLFYPEEMVIKGTPQASRDWWVEVELPDRICKFFCYVNADPRTLWKNIPSDQKVKTDKDYKAIISPQVDIVGASYRGRSHANKGTYRDDDFYIHSVDGIFFSVVADGAGSAELSSTGSKIFCQSAGQEFVSLLTERKKRILDILQETQFNLTACRQHQGLIECLYEILPAAAYHGRQQLEKLAVDNQVPLKKYNTTALLTFSMQVSKMWWLCASFQVGDGITVALVNDDLYALGVPDGGSFPGETVFVTSDSVFGNVTELVNRIKIDLCPVKPIIISMTDGITDSYFKDKSLTDLQVWKQLISEICDEKGDLLPAAEICEWLDFYTVQEHDDKTITIIKYK